jgi:lysophospholipase L1-like esterase
MAQSEAANDIPLNAANPRALPSIDTDGRPAGMHPNNNGYRVIAEAISPSFETGAVTK